MAFAIFMIGLGIVAAVVGWNLRPVPKTAAVSTASAVSPSKPDAKPDIPTPIGRPGEASSADQAHARTAVPAPAQLSTSIEKLSDQAKADDEAAAALRSLSHLPPGQTSDGETTLPPWRRYAVQVPENDSRPIIALIIDDMGVDRRRSTRIAALSRRLTLSFLPYAPDVTTQVEAARMAGHEIMVHLPMEATDPSADPGPNAVRVGLDASEQMRRLRWNLDQFSGYVGVNNHMGSRATMDTPTMTLVLRELKGRGLLFLDSKTNSNSVAGHIAKNMGMPTISRDVFLDHKETEDAVAAQLKILEEMARHQGAAVAIGHPHDVTYNQLERWLPTLAAKGINLVPLSAVVKRSYQTG